MDHAVVRVGPGALELEPAASAKALEIDLSAQIAEKIQEIRFYITQEMWEPAKSAILDLTELAPDALEVTELNAEVSAGQAKSRSPEHAEPLPELIEESPAAFVPTEIVEPSVSEPPSPPPTLDKEPSPAMEPAPVQDLENVLDMAEAPKAKPSESVPAAKEESTEDIFSDFVLDLEQSELADFTPKGPSSAPAPSVAPEPALEQRANGNLQDAETANVLGDILSELREETSEDAEPEEDPETHYNLGIAFKEMGLLDEAIGELQKVCHAVDGGVPFSQPIQAFTWLAQCLVDIGAPEAAVRWYQKALQLPGLDHGSRCAIYYDLGAAYQASGDNKSALANFMEVYGSNIDFRDVASRIKALKS